MLQKSIIKKSLSVGFVAKIIGVFLSFVTLPIVLDYLGEENYGVWITIFSVLTWINYFDVGIGHGLRNKLTEALAADNIVVAKQFISTAYFVITIITLFIFIFGSILIYNIKIIKVLNIAFINEPYIKMVVFISFLFVLGNFIIGLYKQLFYSIHKSEYASMTVVVYQSLVIILLLFFRATFESSLLMLAYIYGIAQILVGIIFTFIFFSKRPDLIPSIKYIATNKILDIVGLGLGFFLIQICMIVIFTTDNIIISYFLGPEFVTSYSIVLRIYQNFVVISSIILMPFWALYTNAMVNRDKDWIINAIRKFNYLFILCIAVVFLFTIKVEFLLGLWLGKDLIYPDYLISLCAVFILVRIYGDIYMIFLNGIGQIKVQLYLYLCGAIVNIPLSIYFVTSTSLGSTGVILATIISMASFVFILPAQTFYIIKKMDSIG